MRKIYKVLVSSLMSLIMIFTLGISSYSENCDLYFQENTDEYREEVGHDEYREEFEGELAPEEDDLYEDELDEPINPEQNGELKEPKKAEEPEESEEIEEPEGSEKPEESEEIEEIDEIKEPEEIEGSEEAQEIEELEGSEELEETEEIEELEIGEISINIFTKTDKELYTAGDIIFYDIELENNGEEELENLIIIDDFNGASSLSGLKVGEEKIISREYEICLDNELEVNDDSEEIINNIEVTVEFNDEELKFNSSFTISVEIQGRKSKDIQVQILSLPEATIMLGDSIDLDTGIDSNSQDYMADEDYINSGICDDEDINYTYEWRTLGHTEVFSTDENPLVSPREDTIYECTVSSLIGCEFIITMTVIVKKGSITVGIQDDVQNPYNSNQEFDIFVNGPNYSQYVLTLKSGQFETINNLPKGSYWISETLPMNYRLVGISQESIDINLYSLTGLSIITNELNNDSWFYDDHTLEKTFSSALFSGTNPRESKDENTNTNLLIQIELLDAAIPEDPEKDLLDSHNYRGKDDKY